MLIIEQPIKDKVAVIQIPEIPEEVEKVIEWLESHKYEWIACDTETTGLDIFSDSYKVRTVQFGVGLEAFVVPIYLVDDWSFIKEYSLVFHNAPFDYLSILRYLGVRLDWNNIYDTKILAHLVDSRSVKDGGPGLSLQELIGFYFDKAVAEDIKGSMTKLARELKIKKSELFEKIDLWNHTYLMYAGMDVVLTHWLFNYLLDKVPESARHLVRREHEIARICTSMEETGFLLDVEYAENLSHDLLQEQEAWESLAYWKYGVESVNSTAEVAEALIEDGVVLNDLTDTGKYKVNSDILQPLADKGNILAQCVIAAKGYKKQRTSWVDKFIESRDSNNRCHASIMALQARTGRMSITGIPAQTLPSKDRVIRDCFIADPGEVIVSCDYKAQELRVLAALSGDANMINAFKHDADLHQMTADASGVDREVGKTVNFAYVYGSGPRNIAETCDISVAKARQVIKGFETTYPKVKAYSEHLQDLGQKQGYITTPYGRRLYIDKDRGYAALNYMVQSTSRDVTCDALLALDKAGFTPYLRLPIHDEVVVSIPAEHAEYGAAKIAKLMEKTIGEVHIKTDSDIYGRSWGDGYKDK